LKERLGGNCLIINQESFSNNPKVVEKILRERVVSGNVMKMEDASTVTQFLEKVKPIEG
jgi:enolase